MKVLLSVGGWGSSRFSEMAQTDSTRMAFAADCKRVIDQFDLDGIDIDWEYPGIGTAGVSFRRKILITFFVDEGYTPCYR